MAIIRCACKINPDCDSRLEIDEAHDGHVPIHGIEREGTVHMSIHLDANGIVEMIRVLRSRLHDMATEG